MFFGFGFIKADIIGFPAFDILSKILLCIVGFIRLIKYVLETERLPAPALTAPPTPIFPPIEYPYHPLSFQFPVPEKRLALTPPPASTFTSADPPSDIVFPSKDEGLNGIVSVLYATKRLAPILPEAPP